MHKSFKLLALGFICSILAGSHTSLAMGGEIPELERLTASERGREALVSLYEARAAAQHIINRHDTESFYEHISHPDTIVRLTVAFAPITPLVTNWIYKKVYGDPEQQSIEQKLRLNNITIEQAELDLEVKKSKFKAQDMMQKLAIQNEAIKLHKEETKLQVVTSLTSLAEKEANGEELTDKQKEYYQICSKGIGV